MDTRELAVSAIAHDAVIVGIPRVSLDYLPLMVLGSFDADGLVGTPFANYFEAFIHPPKR